MPIQNHIQERTRAQISSNAIERMYIAMRHLFNRGYYKPMGVSGETLRNSLLVLQPEIYGNLNGDQVELKGLIYVLDRLPEGIEECTYVNLTAEEGYSEHFQVIIPKKRRRNCYRIDESQMNIEITRGRSEVYDILTHLTFLYIESHKIRHRVFDEKDANTLREWKFLEDIVLYHKALNGSESEVLLVHLSSILGRTYHEVKEAHDNFATASHPHRFAHIIYWMGKLAVDEFLEHNKQRTIKFTPDLRESIGHHIYGEIWANKIKKYLLELGVIERPIHIISANMHSVMNSLYAKDALPELSKEFSDLELYKLLSQDNNENLRQQVLDFALQNGLTFIDETQGTNIQVQIIDTEKMNVSDWQTPPETLKPVLIVMDYAFGEQAFETMDELLKPYKTEHKNYFLDVDSISIMGKAGILNGDKGDIMIPTSHFFEGTADNYPFKNELKKSDFEGNEMLVTKGAMITVLGTSLQNKDILTYFRDSTWKVIGLEMEGAHYQKAIQAASKIRGNIGRDVKVCYAYYASDNPLKTGSTLASGGLGLTGVKPTYLITLKILEQIFVA